MKERIEEKFSASAISGEVLTGHPKDCIVKDADNWGADLIVLGTHGRKGFARAFLGSVASEVASQAPCSVEIIRERKH